MRFYKLMSVLLDYPDRETIEHLGDIEAMLPTWPGIAPEERQALQEFIAWSSRLSATQLQETYVQTFDLTPDMSLHLTHHLFEEQDRDRGLTLVNLSQFFKQNGYRIENGELPDYLPLLLEYVSTLENAESARDLLRQCAQALRVVTENLEKIGSPYAPLLKIVEHHCGPLPGKEAQELASRQPACRQGVATDTTCHNE